MRKLLLFLVSLLHFSFITAQQTKLSAQSDISVLTIAPGTSLNDAFGHSAFRIKDKKNSLDVIYDYGRFDFEAPNFYLNFAKGKLNYSIGSGDFYRFIRFYVNQNRTVKEQILNLTETEKQTLYNFLVENNKPKNKNYLYEFFYDNCATRIKDVISISVNNTLRFNEPENFENATFRTLIQNNLNRNSWASLGIDIALGSVIDVNAKSEEHMFLPEHIYTFFEIASVKNNKRLVKKSNILFEGTRTEKSSNFLTSPLFVFGIISFLILVVTLKDYKNSKQTKWLDIILFGTTGIIGLLILLLWFATDHRGTHQNYNLLWAFVLNIVFIRQLLKKKTPIWFIKYLKFLIILLCLLVLHWLIGVQVFATGLIPLLVALFIRYLYLINFFQKRS